MDEPKMTDARNTRRSLSGVVVSDKMDKSITVRVERLYRHAKYGKIVRRHDKYHAHDEKNEARLGDEVEIMATRPMSKTKRWRLVRVVSSSITAMAE